MLFQPNSQIEFYDKRALLGWDKDNFTNGSNDGIFEMEGIKFGIRICFEIRFLEFFRELYKSKTDINYDEILEIIKKYGLPQEWNEDGKYGPERYIEAHIWSDEVIGRYLTKNII